MTRWGNPTGYEGHATTEFYTLANKSSMYWPTLNCSRPLDSQSTIASWVKNIVGSNDRPGLSRTTQPIQIVDELELVHLGAAACRVRFGAVEGVANESQGKILEPGEVLHLPYRIADFLTVYTSSNVSQRLELTMVWYR